MKSDFDFSKTIAAIGSLVISAMPDGDVVIRQNDQRVEVPLERLGSLIRTLQDHWNAMAERLPNFRERQR